MEQLIVLFILIPFLGFVLNAIIPNNAEVRLSQVSIGALGVQLVSAIGFTVWWLISGSKALYFKQFVLLHLENFELYIDFVFDGTSAVFLLVGAFIAFLILVYSRNYLHRESGFKRFFATILFFYLGYNVIILSGNLTTIFIGWEIVGIASFLLIAFYRNRFIPVKNAVKIFSVYRLGDVALLLAMWLSHQIWHEHTSLHEYLNTTVVIEHVENHPVIALGFSICILIAALIKGAQFPFSAWLSRALEGPTPSSAIFYSSLAIHFSVLVLLRTYDFWIQVPYFNYVVLTFGAFSFLVATLTARIQPSIKGQLAYATIAQVGILFIEIALGWHTLALVHFASHALLRSYQYLISPSLVNYALKLQFFEFQPIKRTQLNPFVQKIKNSIYILSLNEWYLDSFMYYLVWFPFKKMGLWLKKLPNKFFQILAIVLLVLIPILIYTANQLPEYNQALTSLLLVLAFVYIVRAFTVKERVLFAWYNIGVYHVLLMAAMLIHGLPIFHLSFYAFGIFVAYVTGHLAINHIRKYETIVSLNGYLGHCYEYPFVEFFFFLSSLGLMGFPVTTAFIGSELMLNSFQLSELFLLAIFLLSFLANGLVMVRMYARVFLGPHLKTYHTQARKSS